jgi:hypothetical protein
MSGTPRGTSQPLMVSVRSCARPSTLSLRARGPGRATDVAHDGTCFPAIPSASYTSCAAMALRSSPWRTGGGDPGTGGRDSETPSNKPLERAGANPCLAAAAASAGRSAPSR